ncbi:MAG TPA: hypothetical protein VMV08_01310 [Gaiellaceae bacterium]|nr:hypothetical protein [Gaiellaceae bacterium]
MDRSVLSNAEVDLFAVAGVLAALALLAYRARRSSRSSRRSICASVWVAVPFAAPLIVIGSGGALAYFARRWGHPVRGPDGTVGSINHYASEDQSAFGPIGTVVLLGAPPVTALLYAARRVDLRQLALALVLPLFFGLTSLELSFNAFLTRFLLVPAALTAPLLARLFRGRATTAAYAVAGCLVAGLTITHGRPWS